MSKNDGGPAYPVMHTIDGNWVPDTREDRMGMSLRDWFAGMALQGLIERKFDAATAANLAYHHADAMIVERDK